MSQYSYLYDDTFLIQSFMSTAECRRMIAYGESLGFQAAPINTGFGFAIASDIRNNTRVMFDDSFLAQTLWLRCADMMPLQIPGRGLRRGLNERFRLYRYQPGQAFRWHRDGSFRRDPQTASQMTLLIYLNTDFTGGATRFTDFSVQPRTGMGLCFAHKLLHEGAAVSEGVKYVLRTDVMYQAAAGNDSKSGNGISRSTR